MIPVGDHIAPGESIHTCVILEDITVKSKLRIICSISSKYTCIAGYTEHEFCWRGPTWYWIWCLHQPKCTTLSLDEHGLTRLVIWSWQTLPLVTKLCSTSNLVAGSGMCYCCFIRFTGFLSFHLCFFKWSTFLFKGYLVKCIGSIRIFYIRSHQKADSEGRWRIPSDE